MSFRFVANLKPYTFHRGRGVRRFDAYLLSVDFAGPTATALANRALKERRLLCADNGNVDAIRKLIRVHQPRARALDDRRKQEEKALRRYARPGDLSKELTREYQALVRDIRTASALATPKSAVGSALERQRAMNPSYAIGPEDLTIATLTGLSVEPEYSGLPRRAYARLNRRAVALAVNAREGRFGTAPATLFAGVHALDFDQAVDAGRLVGEAGLRGIATGLVGALRDRNSIDFRVENKRLIELEETTARPYLRVLEIAAGLHVGFRRATGKWPRFHALGAGTPILLPILATLGGPGSGRYTATDSTAPIVDGWSGPTIGLYIDDPAPLKLRADKIADSWLRGGRGWDCECSYCRRFEEQHPAQLARATRWWKEVGRPRITKKHLHRSGPLAPLLPFLARHPDDAIRRAAGLARVGHNHAVIQRLERVVDEAISAGRLETIDAMVSAYLEFPGAARWRASAREAYGVAVRARATLRSEGR